MNDFRIFLLFILLLIANISTAQFTAGVKLDLVSNDVNLTSGNLDLGKVLQSKFGYKIGASVSYDVTDRFSVESGLSYNKLGFLVSQNTDINLFGLNVPIGATLNTNFSYLEIPLMANYKIDLGHMIGYIEAGPSVNYATNGRIKTVANSILDFNIIERNIDFQNNRFNRTNLSGNIGMGLTQAVTPDVMLSVGVKYSKDFTSSVEIPIVDARIKNQSIGFGAKLSKRF